MDRKRLTDILHGGERDAITSAWQTTEAAEDFTPLPTAEYIAHIISGELFASKSNHTPGYKLTFKVIEGEYQGRARFPGRGSSSTLPRAWTLAPLTGEPEESISRPARFPQLPDSMTSSSSSRSPEPMR